MRYDWKLVRQAKQNWVVCLKVLVIDVESSKQSHKQLIYSNAGSTTRRYPMIEYNRMTKSKIAEMDQFTLSHSLTASRRV